SGRRLRREATNVPTARTGRQTPGFDTPVPDMPVTPSLARFAGLAAATVAGVCAVGTWPTLALSGTDGVVAMAVAAGISLVGAVVGFLPSSMASASGRYEARVQAAMLGVALRMLATLTAVLAVVLSGAPVARVPFVAWIGVEYAAMLVLETLVV